MKATHILLALFLMPLKHALALSPVSTSTFVNPCLPFASITPLTNTYGCFSYSASNAGASGPNDYYSWNFGDGDSAVGNPVYHCYPSSSVTTIYTVTVGYNSAILCGLAPTTQNYTLSLNSSAQFNCISNTFPVNQSAQSVTVDLFVLPDILVVSYNYGDSSSFTFSNMHTYAACGNYIIQVKTKTLTNPPDSCITYKAVNLSCKPSINGIPTYSKNQPTMVFPNPVSEALNISSAKTIRSISVVDLIGKGCLQENEVNNTQAQLKIQDFYPGTYFVKLVYADNFEEHIKFIKK